MFLEAGGGHIVELSEKPIDDGFRIPGEFENQSRCFIVWPQRPDNWREGGKPAQKSFACLAEKLANIEKVTMLVNEDQYENARNKLSSNIRVVEMSSNDAWMKDFGPFYVINDKGKVRSVIFQFNAWGGLLDGLYFPWDKDNQVALKVSDLENLDYYKVNDFVLEGCAVHVDGQGTLIATEDVVLSEGRNPGILKASAETFFHDYLGIKKTIWLPHGYFMDETNGDIDNMINYVAPGEIVLTWTDDKTDPQYPISLNAFNILSNSVDARGRKLIIHKLQMPKPLTLSREEANGVDPINGRLPRIPGQRLTASYVSYITTNEALIVPEFDDPQDEIAKKQLAILYPGRKIIGLAAREFLIGGGNIHTIVGEVPGKLVK